MSASTRTSNLFASEDYQKIFKAYAFIDYTAYDFDTLKQAMINYVQTYYPEDFNDYIESSEFIAIIELLAYFGTSLAFRTDLNSRENFIDTAERRESIIRLAQMVNYVPRRNIPASGLFKISAVQTDQPLTDANGVDINNYTIFWNDPNNPDWFDQFVQVCNAAFSQVNPFGRPTKSGQIGSIPTDLYQLNNVTRLNVTYPTVVTINGQQYPIDICNPDFVTNQTIFERDPDPANAFNFLYRNDSLGVSSANTGFFLYFKQGNLINNDVNFDFPVPNRLFPINIQNINQDDVYVQETDQSGTVINKWLKVPALAGENIIYNSIQFAQRNIFDVLSGANDSVTIRFADGNFGNVPTGLFRVWTRISANQALVIRPNDAQGLQINIPYIGVDQQSYTLRIVFNLEQTIGNASASETSEQIKLRAPEVFSTQSRMVNGSDYNVLPLVYGNQITKIKALDRTYSGQSRYIDLNDPTGFHKDLIIFGQDGALFRDNQNILTEVVQDSSNVGTINQILTDTIQTMLRDPKVNTFFYDEYLPQFESKIRVNPPSTGRSLLNLVPTVSDVLSKPLFWKTSPAKFKNSTGYFTNLVDTTGAVLENTFTSANIDGSQYQAWGLIKAGAVVEFANPSLITSTNTAKVNSVVSGGVPATINPLNPYADVGPVELGIEEPTSYQAVKVYPIFRSTLTAPELVTVVNAVTAGISFWLYYDLLEDVWKTSTATTAGLGNQADQPWEYATPDIISSVPQIYSTTNWPLNSAGGLLYVNISSGGGTTTYDLTARGRTYIFESYRDVRFYWDPNEIVIDNSTGLALQDTVEIMPFVNTNNIIDNNIPVISNPAISFLNQQVAFNVSGVFVQTDGYLDPAKVEVALVDSNNDGIADNPVGFDTIVSPTDRVVFEYYTNDITGYQSTRPWISKWKTDLQNETGLLYVYFPIVTPGSDTTLYSAPYIANALLTLNANILDPGTYKLSNPTFIYVYMDEADLLFINKLTQIEYTDPVTTPTITVANQLTAFFNSDTTTYSWLVGIDKIVDKSSILSTYFTSKSYLLSSISPPGFGVYYALSFQSTSNTGYPTGYVVQNSLDTTRFDKNGKVFTQNTTVPTNEQLPLYFKWSHYSPIDQRIDPSVTNIIDMVVITDSYYRDVTIWKNANSTLSSFPAPPSTESLRIQFQDLDQYKMVSDSMIWNSGTFKILFGSQAATELQATFKVVKSPTTTVSDNEVKTQVITAIDQFFDIRNWDFGEKFFYTELAAFIHQQLSRVISSVVIVPNNANAMFGNLFEIIASPTELFISTATVNNVSIVSNFTDANLRV
jgi:hypothetical protein